ncbi:MAG: hypothetical protein PHT60_14010 [Acidiphilium sp.]|nr:hypothetical protein [Acidiphilium sp.]MDD4936880.1 hypothetical protein [Acidiphilium sp.]
MLPTVLARAIRLPLLTPEPFTPTKWDDAPIKAKFGNHLLRFIAEDFPEHMFTQKFYARLANTFGHIAHYNKHGFWSEFFLTRETKIEFLDQTIRHPCYGDPAWTYSDVERVIRARLKQSGVIDWHRRLLVQETEAQERAEYQRLARKFAPKPTDGTLPDPEDTTSAAQTYFQTEIVPADRTSAQPHAPSTSRSSVTAPMNAQPDLFAGL